MCHINGMKNVNLCHQGTNQCKRQESPPQRKTRQGHHLYWQLLLPMLHNKRCTLVRLAYFGFFYNTFLSQQISRLNRYIVFSSHNKPALHNAFLSNVYPSTLTSVSLCIVYVKSNHNERKSITLQYKKMMSTQFYQYLSTLFSTKKKNQIKTKETKLLSFQNYLK
jgi:hypothetical protein